MRDTLLELPEPFSDGFADFRAVEGLFRFRRGAGGGAI